MSQKNSTIRYSIANEAARLMYQEDVKEYYTAKRMAAKRLFGKRGGKKLHYRPGDLPSNGEIRDALYELVELAEGALRQQRLGGMRLVAFCTMTELLPFYPRLIGSVSTGAVRYGSDIDIQLFVDAEEEVEQHLWQLRWSFDRQQVCIHKFGEFREYTHYYIVDSYPVELTVYPKRELRFTPRSSTDGKPIVRLKPGDVQSLLQAEHPEVWQAYDKQGVFPELIEQEQRPGLFDSLLSRET